MCICVRVMSSLALTSSEGHMTVSVSSVSMAICNLSIQPMVGLEWTEGREGWGAAMFEVDFNNSHQKASAMSY